MFVHKSFKTTQQTGYSEDIKKGAKVAGDQINKGIIRRYIISNYWFFLRMLKQIGIHF